MERATRAEFALPVMRRIALHMDSPAPRGDRCWIWKGGIRADYGSLTVDGKRDYVHRIVFRETRGPIPEGFHIDHLCGRKLCANPRHLRAIPANDNSFERGHFEQRLACVHGGVIIVICHQCVRKKSVQFAQPSRARQRARPSDEEHRDHA